MVRCHGFGKFTLRLEKPEARGQSRLINPETQAFSIGHKTQNKNKESKINQLKKQK